MTIALESARRPAFDPTWATLAHSLFSPQGLESLRFHMQPVILVHNPSLLTLYSNWQKPEGGIWHAERSKLPKEFQIVFPGMGDSTVIVAENDNTRLFAHLSDITVCGEGGVDRVIKTIQGVLGDKRKIDIYHMRDPRDLSDTQLVLELQSKLGLDEKTLHKIFVSWEEIRAGLNVVYDNGRLSKILNYPPGSFKDISGNGKWNSEIIGCDNG